MLLIILVLFAQLFLWGNFFSYLDKRSPEREITLPGGEGESPLVVTVICNNILEGRTELPDVLDPSIRSRVQDACERIEAQTPGA